MYNICDVLGRLSKARGSQQTCSTTPAPPISTCDFLLLHFPLSLAALPPYALETQSVTPLPLIIADVRRITFDESRWCGIVCRTAEATAADGRSIFEVLGSRDRIRFEVDV